MFAVLYGSNVLLPQMLQAVYGYDAYKAGLIMSPGGIAVMVFMPLSGFLLGRQWDARYLIFFGVLSVAAASYWNALLNLEASPWVLVMRRCANCLAWPSSFAGQHGGLHLLAPRTDDQRHGPVQHDVATKERAWELLCSTPCWRGAASSTRTASSKE